MKKHSRLIIFPILFSLTVFIGSCGKEDRSEYTRSTAACVRMASEGLLEVAEQRAKRFHGKVQEDTALCRGGDNAVKYRDVPWLDWANYWGAGDASSMGPDKTGAKHLSPTGRGIDGALMDLEYQRIELIEYNLFDNYTYKGFVKGVEGRPGSVIKVWDEMRLPNDHPNYADVGGDDEQICSGDLIRHRNLTGLCNDITNPLMGSTNTLFARNVQFEASFPRLGQNEMARNRHGDRLSLLMPDPQLISRRLFTRQQSEPAACANGYGAGDSGEASCDYIKAPFFNVMAAFWIQFMNHDWFSHLEEGDNQASYMEVGCDSSKAEELGCRPNDQIDKAIVAQDDPPGKFTHKGAFLLWPVDRALRT